MLTLFSDHVGKSMKDLMTINAGAVEQFSQQQTELITGLISDHINYATSLGKQRDYKEWISINQAYTEAVKTRVLKSMNSSYSLFTESKDKTPAAKTVSKQPSEKPASKPVAKTAAKPKSATTRKTAASKTPSAKK